MKCQFKNCNKSNKMFEKCNLFFSSLKMEMQKMQNARQNHFLKFKRKCEVRSYVIDFCPDIAKTIEPIDHLCENYETLNLNLAANNKNKTQKQKLMVLKTFKQFNQFFLDLRRIST